MTVLTKPIAVTFPLLANVGMRSVRPNQNRIAGRSRPSRCFGRTRRHPHRRMRLLQRLGQHFHLVERKEAAAIAQLFTAPGPYDHVDGLAEALLTLAHRHLERAEFTIVEASPGTPIHPSTG